MRWVDRVGRHIKPYNLHVFLAVIEQSNMAKAADHLSISRPVVSKAITELELALGVRLFDRGPQGVEPTVFGRALAKRSVALFDELNHTVKELEFLSDPNRGELRIGCTEVTAAGFVSAVIAEIAEKYPGLAIRTEMSSVVQQHTPLRQRRCEIFIARAFAAEPEPDMEREALFFDWHLVAVGPESKWIKRRTVRLADLQHEKWIVSPGEAQQGGLFSQAFLNEKLECPVPAILSDSLNLRDSLLARMPDFVTFVPGSVLHFGPPRPTFKILPVKLQPWNLPISITKLRGRALTPAAAIFVKLAQQKAATLSDRMILRDATARAAARA